MKVYAVKTVDYNCAGDDIFVTKDRAAAVDKANKLVDRLHLSLDKGYWNTGKKYFTLDDADSIPNNDKVYSRKSGSKVEIVISKHNI